METTWHDLRFAARMLAKKPGFTLVAVVALALGIGANTAIFSVVNSVLLEPLPYREPERLMMVWEDATSLGYPRDTPAPANFVDWRDQNSVFEGMAASASETFNITGDGEPEKIEAARVSAGLFRLLGVMPASGRDFAAEEDQPGGERVAVISHGLWQRRYGARPEVVGGTVTLDGEPHTVVGIMPPRFEFPSRGVDVWVPIALGGEEAASRGNHYLEVVARLKPGVNPAQAQSDMDAVARRLQELYPDTNTGLGVAVVPLHEQLVGEIRPALLILLGAVGLVLLIACANVANLLLARAAARYREAAVRAALGAGRLRLVRQFLTESLLIAMLGGAAGLLLAFAGLRVLAAFIPEEISLAREISLDPRVLAFTVAISAATGIVFGLVPALQASSPNLNDSLKEGGRDPSAAGKSRARSTLVISEVALALVLLIGAGLLINSFVRLQSVDPGFRSDNLLTMSVVLPDTKYPDASRRAAFYDQTLARVGALPGVESAAVVTRLPLTFKGNANSYSVEGFPEPSPDQRPIAVTRVISPDYFRAMGIAVLRGRHFTPQDREDSGNVVVVNETFANRYWPGDDPVGKRIKMGSLSSDAPWLTIVGVAADVRQFELSAPPRPQMYLPYTQLDFFSPRDLVVRTASDPLALATAVRNEVWAVDPDQPVSNVRTMGSIVAESLARQRFSMLLLAIFAGVALALAAVGIYGVLSYTVTQRTREIGIRMALGAERRDVMRLVVGQGFRLVVIGLAIGIVAALGLSRLMASLLFGVSPSDPATFLAVPAVLAAVALVASYVPARRATRVDPMRALRYE
jgi:putative ABC transport system permease protein